MFEVAFPGYVREYYDYDKPSKVRGSNSLYRVSIMNSLYRVSIANSLYKVSWDKNGPRRDVAFK